MKIIAYTALHYGSEYLGWVIRSVIDQVDEYWVLYAAQGSHGHRSDLPCPDSRALLMSIASKAAGSKLHWIDGEWPHEGAQRNAIHAAVPDADVILVLDADEIWPTELTKLAVDYAWRMNIRELRVPMIHYWRSFYRCMIHDFSYPVRVLVPHTSLNVQSATLETAYCQDDKRWINHMGYAQRPVTVGYKQYVHGHKNEWRHDIDWFKERYVANAQHDCHPVTANYWNPVPVNPLDYMPSWMVEHPYFNMEVIK